MEELKKIRRVMSRIDETAPHETMLVVDAGTGQNALNQAREFNQAVGLTGITLTKLDGTARGGVLFGIAHELGLPIRFIGVGEAAKDLRPVRRRHLHQRDPADRLMPRAASLPFAQRLLDWWDQHGRHDLPWQHPRTPYRVWISEIMLQQTQVGTVIPYFERWMQDFPDVPTLAAAPLDEVLSHWSGLGYYARARNLHRAAIRCVEEHGGDLPQGAEALGALPGIGLSTANAIVSQSTDQPAAVLDGNVRRVLARHAAVEGWTGQAAVQKQLWLEAEMRLPARARRRLHAGRHGSRRHALHPLEAGLRALPGARRLPGPSAGPGKSIADAKARHQGQRPDSAPVDPPRWRRPRIAGKTSARRHLGRTVVSAGR